MQAVVPVIQSIQTATAAVAVNNSMQILLTQVFDVVLQPIILGLYYRQSQT